MVLERLKVDVGTVMLKLIWLFVGVGGIEQHTSFHGIGAGTLTTNNGWS
jgi:hypothetical protein